MADRRFLYSVQVSSGCSGRSQSVQTWEFTVPAGEDAIVFLVRVSLDGLGSMAAVHANVALLQCHLHRVAEEIAQYPNRQRLASTPEIDHLLTDTWSLRGLGL